MKLLLTATVLGCLLVVALASHAAAAGQPLRTLRLDADAALWEEFKAKYNKVYATEEEHASRKAVFVDNMKTARRMNRLEIDEPFGMTQFSDLTEDEFKATYLMQPETVERLVAERRATARVADLSAYDNVKLPVSFDWRDKKGVTAVKNQGQCGSCWAFSTTENVESIWHIEGNHPLVDLSVSQIVDCDHVDQGCNGGDLPTAFKYVEENGLESEAAYPYSARDGRCRYDKSKVVARIDGWEYASKDKNETQMQVYVYNKAPISICVDALSWQLYSGGVITRNCGKQLDHCVQIVGFNSLQKSGKTIPYWIVRNSWGESWGEEGFIYVERNEDLCGIGKEPASAYIN